MAIQESPETMFQTKYHERLIQRVLPDGSLVLVEATIDPTRLLDWQFKRYTPYLVDMICEKITEGMNLTQICRLPGYPTYAELCRWKRGNPDIQAQIEQAKKDRAEHLRDQAMDTIKSLDEDNYSSGKVAIDSLLKLAGADDKEKYGNQKTVAEASVPTVIQIYTGIHRGAEPRTVDEIVPVAAPTSENLNTLATEEKGG